MQLNQRPIIAWSCGGIAVALDLDRSSCAFDLGEIGSGQLDGRCADILLQAMDLRSAWDRDDPRFIELQSIGV